MTPPRHRTFRFVHPDLEVQEGGSGLRIGPTGAIAMVEEEASVRQAVLLLLSTLPGERVMRPGYGCDLHRLIFASNDDTTAGLAIHYLRSALETWEPRVEILKIDALRDPADPGRLDLQLEYRVRSTRRQDAFTLSVPVGGP